MQKTELLLPAGTLMGLKTAILYGADAVYAGLPSLSLRAHSKMSFEDIQDGIKFVHAHGRRIYLTLNLFTHNNDIPKLPKFVEMIKELKPDGLIISDPGVFDYIQKQNMQIPLHISTQANVCSWLTVNYWKEQGASLCVLAREVSFKELKEIREKCPDIKLETFIHGAMCMSYSGRCLISNFLTGRAANKGMCAHCCRWNYKLHLKLKEDMKEIEINEQNKDLFDFFLEEAERPGEFFPIEETEQGGYILSSKDLCLMPKLHTYLEIGIDSLKVEGRNKSEYYVGSIARVYRKAIDAWYQDPEHWSPEPFMQELEKLQNRGYTMAFYEGCPDDTAQTYETTASKSTWRNVGVVKSFKKDSLVLELRNTICPGDEIEFLSPFAFDPICLKVEKLIDSRTKSILTEKASAGQEKAIVIPLDWFKDQKDSLELKKLIPEFTLVRKRI